MPGVAVVDLDQDTLTYLVLLLDLRTYLVILIILLSHRMMIISWHPPQIEIIPLAMVQEVCYINGVVALVLLKKEMYIHFISVPTIQFLHKLKR